MTCPRLIASIEHALHDTLQRCPAMECERATGVSESMLRKCSNPNLPQSLSLKHAAALDGVRLSNGHHAVFGPIFDSLVTEATGQAPNRPLLETVGHYAREVGEDIELITRAISDGEITDAERATIQVELRETAAKLNELVRSISPQLRVAE